MSNFLQYFSIVFQDFTISHTSREFIKNTFPSPYSNLLAVFLHFWLISFKVLESSFFGKCSNFFICCFIKFKTTNANISCCNCNLKLQSCNLKLQSCFTIYSCFYSNYRLKKFATKNCLQLKVVNHVFLQL